MFQTIYNKMSLKSKALQSSFGYLDFSLMDIIEEQLYKFESENGPFTYSKYNVNHCIMANVIDKITYYEPSLSIKNKLDLKESFITLKELDITDPNVATKYAKEMYKYLKFRTLEKEIELFNNEEK